MAKLNGTMFGCGCGRPGNVVERRYLEGTVGFPYEVDIVHEGGKGVHTNRFEWDRGAKRTFWERVVR